MREICGRISGWGLICHTVGVLAEVFVGCVVEFVVPFFSEASDERLLQKFVGANTEFAAQYFGAVAYFPAVEVDRGEVGVFFYSHGIKMARYRLHKVHATLAESAFDGAMAHSTRLVAGKHAIASVDDRGD